MCKIKKEIFLGLQKVLKYKTNNNMKSIYLHNINERHNII